MNVLFYFDNGWHPGQGLEEGNKDVRWPSRWTNKEAKVD